MVSNKKNTKRKTYNSKKKYNYKTKKGGNRVKGGGFGIETLKKGFESTIKPFTTNPQMGYTKLSSNEIAKIQSRNVLLFMDEFVNNRNRNTSPEQLFNVFNNVNYINFLLAMITGGKTSQVTNSINTYNKLINENVYYKPFYIPFKNIYRLANAINERTQVGIKAKEEKEAAKKKKVEAQQQKDSSQLTTTKNTTNSNDNDDNDNDNNATNYKQILVEYKNELVAYFKYIQVGYYLMSIMVSHMIYINYESKQPLYKLKYDLERKIKDVEKKLKNNQETMDNVSIKDMNMLLEEYKVVETVKKYFVSESYYSSSSLFTVGGKLFSKEHMNELRIILKVQNRKLASLFGFSFNENIILNNISQGTYSKLLEKKEDRIRMFSTSNNNNITYKSILKSLYNGIKKHNNMIAGKQ